MFRMFQTFDLIGLVLLERMKIEPGFDLKIDFISIIFQILLM